jgi:NAD(P)-dependent dehydrogenase (short-subunit alcohol dehydrogenase family)
MENPLDLSGQTILVTGASSGIGRGTAVLLSGLGARVVLNGRSVSRLEATAAQIHSDCCRVAPFDLAQVSDISGWLGSLVNDVGPFSALVHCAGIAPILPVRHLTLEHLQELMNVNFYAAAILTKEFSRKRMHQPNSSIVLVASAASACGAAGRAGYGASKGALVAFARSAAIELAPHGIRVNCVSPGFVDTEMHESIYTSEELEQLVAATEPLGLGSAQDVAHAIAFLVAQTGRWITGSVLSVDGGYTAQ